MVSALTEWFRHHLRKLPEQFAVTHKTWNYSNFIHKKNEKLWTNLNDS